MGTYIDAAKLEMALTQRTYQELFALGPTTNQIDTDAVDQVIDRAESMADSYLIGVYDFPLAPATDRLVRHACLMFAQALAFMRNPEYVRTYGEVGKVQLYQEAEKMMQRIQAAKQRLPDQVSKPKNLGGVVAPTGPILIGNCSGDF